MTIDKFVEWLTACGLEVYAPPKHITGKFFVVINLDIGDGVMIRQYVPFYRRDALVAQSTIRHVQERFRRHCPAILEV